MLYAFETCGVPRVIKIIENEKDLRQEFSIWEIISKGAEMDNINLVPILKCVAIPREKGKGSVGGLLMPVYICSLATVPIPSSPQHLLHCTKQVKLALDQMHGSGIGHCDVKPQNIFLDSSGNHFLGDYGAAQRIGDEVVEVSWNYFPDVDWKASKKLDYALLVVSILSQSNVRSIAGPDPSKRTIPILRKEVVETFQMRDLELMNLLLSLLDIK
uniref:Protein kinase domain-containing protein n=1 Tax=Arcella intermedia TaxID=1963864 RepID=A0A6B2LHY3_9EUKA